MSDSQPNPFNAPGHGAAKGVALGLGILLLLGTALMIALLVLQEEEVDPSDLPPIRLGEGERVTDIALHGERILLLIEGEDGEQKVLFLDSTTLEGNELQIFAP
jgi:hypothetical protein